MQISYKKFLNIVLTCYYKEKKSHGLESEIKHVIFSSCFKNKKLKATNISVISYSYVTH